MPGPSQSPDNCFRVKIDRLRHARPIPLTRHQGSVANRQAQAGQGPSQTPDTRIQFIIDWPRQSRAPSREQTAGCS
jgi:hypothetical protein